MQNTQNSQEKNIQNNFPSAHIMQSPEEYVRSLTTSEQRILNNLIDYQLKYKNVCPSIGTIAKNIGVTPMTVSRALKRWRTEGVLQTSYRHMRSNIYYISPFFFAPEVKSRLSHLLKAFRALSVLLLHTALIMNPVGVKPFHQGYVREPSYKVNRNIITLKKYRQMGGVMPDFIQTVRDGHPISPLIRNLKCLRLTKWGQIKLSAFPDEAIAAARARFENANNIRSPFEFFIKACWDYVNLHGIVPDWTWYARLSKVFNMPEDARMVFEGSVTPDEESQPVYAPVEKRAKTGTAKPFQHSVAKVLQSVSLSRAERDAQERRTKEFERRQTEKHKAKLQMSRGPDDEAKRIAFLKFCGLEDT